MIHTKLNMMQVTLLLEQFFPKDKIKNGKQLHFFPKPLLQQNKTMKFIMQTRLKLLQIIKILNIFYLLRNSTKNKPNDQNYLLIIITSFNTKQNKTIGKLDVLSRKPDDGIGVENNNKDIILISAEHIGSIMIETTGNQIISKIKSRKQVPINSRNKC